MMRTPTPHPAVIWGVPLVAGAILVALLATGGNRQWFFAINAWSHVTGPTPWPFLTVLGDTAVAISLFLPFALRRPDVLRALVVGALFATLFVHGLKPLLAEPRPPAVLEPGAITIIGPAYTTRSFPSGHTTTIFMAASLIWLHFRNTGLRALVLAIAITVGLSRVVVGVHWPIDVAAGAAGGWLSGVIGTLLAQRWPAGLRTDVQTVLTAIGVACAVALLAGLHTGYPQAAPLQYTVAVGALAALALAIRSTLRNHRKDNDAR